MSSRKQARYSVDLPVEVRYQNQIQEGRAVNLSVGGMFVRTEAPIPFNATVELRFGIPEPKEDVDVDGQIRWVEGTSNGFGVQFLNLRARYIWALNKYFGDKEPVG